MYILVCVSFFYQLNIHFRIRTLGNLKVTYSGHYSDNKKHLLFKILSSDVIVSSSLLKSTFHHFSWSSGQICGCLCLFLALYTIYVCIRSWLNSYKTHTCLLSHIKMSGAHQPGASQIRLQPLSRPGHAEFNLIYWQLMDIMKLELSVGTATAENWDVTEQFRSFSWTN